MDGLARAFEAERATYATKRWDLTSDGEVKEVGPAGQGFDPSWFKRELAKAPGPFVERHGNMLAYSRVKPQPGERAVLKRVFEAAKETVAE